MRVCALSKSYFEQSTITELISHPSSRAPCPQPITPPGVLPTQGSRIVNHKNVQRLWRDEGPWVPQRRRRKCLGSSTAPGIPTADGAKQVGAVDFQFDATADGRDQDGVRRR
jgi:hypothetical protein